MKSCIVFLVACILLNVSIFYDCARAEETQQISGSAQNGSGLDTEAVNEIGKDSMLAGLKGNISGKFIIRTQGFFHSVEPTSGSDSSTERYFLESRLELSSGWATDRGKFDVSGWLEYGTEDDVWKWYDDFSGFFQDKEEERNILEVNEIFALLYYDTFDVTLGKKIFHNGLAPLYSPADKYGPSDFYDPVYWKKLGSWQATVDYYLSNDLTLTAVFFPVYQPSKIPREGSRWLLNSVDYDFPGGQAGLIPLDIREEIPEVEPENFSYLMRMKAIVGGWDLFVSAYQGLNPLYVQKAEQIGSATVITKEVVDVFNLSAGFSTTYKSWEFHGEAYYSHAPDDNDDEYVNYVAGFSYTIPAIASLLRSNDFKIYADYTREHVFSEQSAPGYIQSSKESRFGSNDLITRIAIDVNDDWDVTLFTAMQLKEDATFMQLEVKHEIKSDLFGVVTLETFSGSEDSFYGRWSENDRATLRLEYWF